MKIYESSKVRNVVVAGHAGSGKTTFVETMLFESGMIQRRGSIIDENTVSDFHSIEKEKQKSVFTTLTHLDWRGTKINLLDTPGTPDFSGEVAGAMAAADAVMFILNAEHGIEVGTELLWKQAEELNLPAFFVVNKPDSDKSDFQKTFDMAREHYGREVVAVQYPFSEGEGFHAIVDVLKMTMYEFPEKGGRPDKLPIPESQKAQAELLQNELVETIAENDESLMDIYFEHGKLDEYQMRDGLKSAIQNRQVFPLFCVCAERNMGSGRVMSFIGNVLPSPDESERMIDTEGSVVTISANSKPSLFSFKTISEAHVGDLTYLKALGGTLKSGMDLENKRSSDTLRTGAFFISQGNKRVEVSEVKAGDLAVAVKLKDVASGDTLAEKGNDFSLAPIKYPTPIIRTAVKLLKEGDEDKLGTALHQLEREDQSLKVEHSQELKQILLHGLGEEHLAVAKYQLEKRFKLDVEFVRPRIPYRETITKSVKAHYKHKKQSGGAGQFADVHLLIEPYMEGMPNPPDLNVRDTQIHDLPWGGKLVFLNCIVGGVIDNRFMPAILKGVMEKMENGPMSGCRARDIRVSVFDGSMHSVDSNEAAFKTASLMAFKEGFLNAAPQLMEPVYDIEISVPAVYMGDVLSDLSSRRGQVQGMDAEGAIQKIKAKVPLDELDHYSTRLKSITQGSASYSREFSHYASVPHDIQDKVMKETLALDATG